VKRSLGSTTRNRVTILGIEMMLRDAAEELLDERGAGAFRPPREVATRSLASGNVLAYSAIPRL